MSDETLTALQAAAKAFKADVEQLPGLRAALAAHDADEAANPPSEPSEAPASAESQTAAPEATA